MSNSGQTAPGQVQAFNSPKVSSPITTVVSLGFKASGVAMAAVAAATAMTPIPHSSLVRVSEIMGKVGLDKGPMALFGGLFFAAGVAVARAEKARQAAAGSKGIMDLGQQFASEAEGQTALLATVQEDISTLRAELHAVRVEAQQAREESQTQQTSGEASDPMFRLAASLDQLGARIGKRMESTRQEMLDAVQNVTSNLQPEESSGRNAAEMESLRSDIAALTEQLAEVAGDVTAALAAQEAAGREIASMSWELSEVAGNKVPAVNGASDASANQGSSKSGQTPSNFGDKGPEPPAPIPSTSEGLDLIDEMDASIGEPKVPGTEGQ